MDSQSSANGRNLVGKKESDFWVFGYGSLMWRPGFAFISRHRAAVSGWSRRLCIWSHHYRGTPERPGLVLGLDRGGECAGVAFRVNGDAREAVLDYLRERELVTNVYIETNVDVRLADGREVLATTYVADVDHPQYAPAMPETHVLEIVRHASGASGENRDYVLNTRDHLVELGIVDHELEWLAERLTAA